MLLKVPNKEALSLWRINLCSLSLTLRTHWHGLSGAITSPPAWPLSKIFAAPLIAAVDVIHLFYVPYPTPPIASRCLTITRVLS